MLHTISRRRLLQLQALLRRKQKKVAASMTLAGEVLEGVNLIVPAKHRSRFVEAAVRRELRRRVRQARAAQDLAILNRRAEQLDRETNDLIRHQADPFA